MDEPTLDKLSKKALTSITVERAFIISRLVIAAERLMLFRLLKGRRMKAERIGHAIKLHPAYRDAFLNSLVAIGLLHKRGDVYWNTAVADKYFVRDRSIYWTRQYSKECVENYQALTVLEESLVSGRSYKQIRRLHTPSYTEAMKHDPQQAVDFTQMLFHYHREDALQLARSLDLSKHSSVLDVGGGSGVMSIALAKENPHLRACIVDIAPVCEIAAKNVRRAGLSRRVTTLAGDILRPLPTGYDVIMFCDVGSISTQMLRNAYRSLPEGGLVVLVDRYLTEDRTEPIDRVIGQLIASSFPSATSAEMVRAVKLIGFKRVKARRVSDFWVITGSK